MPTDVAAQIEWHSRHGRERLQHIAVSITDDRAAAEDAVGMAFCDAWRSRAGWLDYSNVAGWLTRGTVNRARDMRTKRRLMQLWTRKVVDVDGFFVDKAELLGTTETPESVYLDAEACDTLWEAVAALPLEHLEIVLGLTRDEEQDEAAERLGIPIGTVKSRIHYARKKLRKALEEG